MYESFRQRDFLPEELTRILRRSLRLNLATLQCKKKVMTLATTLVPTLTSACSFGYKIFRRVCESELPKGRRVRSLHGLTFCGTGR